MATCKDCISTIVCPNIEDAYANRCKFFKEKSRYIELPCKIGDTVYAIRDYKGHKHPQSGTVGEMFFMPDMSIQIVVKHIARGKWGVDIFPTYEEAEKAISERAANNGRKQN